MSIRTRNEKKADDIDEALRQDNIHLQTSVRIMAENLEILRGKLAEIRQIACEALVAIADTNVNMANDLREIIDLAKPIESATEA